MKQAQVACRFLFLLAALASLSHLGCTNVVARGRQSTGAIVIDLPASLGRSARTILPAFASLVDSVSVSVSALGHDSQNQSTSEIGGTITFTGLPVATWKISASALKGESVIGSGGTTVAVSAGSTSAVVIPISFSGFATGRGTLALPITWPSSTGVDYLAWSVDGGEATEATIAKASGISRTILSTSLDSGAHSLHLTFRSGGSAGAVAGSFVESVDIWSGLTSGSWVDGSGNLQGAMSFEADSFLDSDASLEGLVVQDGSSSGLILPIGFASSKLTYDLYTMPSSQSIVFTPTESVEGQYLSYTWNGGAATEAPSGSASGNLAFVTSAYDNRLAVSVRAPDRSTLKTYTITWHGAVMALGVSTPTSYVALTFADNPPVIAQGDASSIVTNNSALAAVTSGWIWYVDGSKQAETSALLSLDSSMTSSMTVGNHFISATVVFGGLTYSGSLILTVDKSS